MTVSLDIYKICVKIEKATAALAKDCSQAWAKCLWIYKGQDGSVKLLTHHGLSDTAINFAKAYGLLRDDGTPLKISSQMFRNTRHNRILKLARGNLLAAARSSGNTPETASRYMEVTPEQLAHHRFAGQVMLDKLAEYEKTPVGGCKDVINGELAPKNGEPCVDFFSCFRCKSQVITADDLYRLYSFYWAVYRERQFIGAKKWKAYFAWLVRMIDRDIAPNFHMAKVNSAKKRARENPHPMWKTRDGLLINGAK